MRRGLMGREESELPVAAIEARLARLREAMAGADLDAFVLYTDNTRPSAVTWTTGFTPYWSDALLLVGRDGAPVFATALSKRVSEWIRTTDPVSEIANTARPGSLIGDRLTKAGVKRAAVLEYDTLPGGLAEELVKAAPLVEWSDGTALFAGLRRSPDEAERKLLARADAIAAAALEKAVQAQDAATLTGAVEQSARLAGAEEAYIAVAPDLAADRRLNRTSQPTPLADRYAVRASVAYKGCWVRRVRTFAKDGAAAKADAWLADVIGSLEAGKSIASQLAGKVKTLSGAALTSWTAEGCTGSYPLQSVATSCSDDNALVGSQFLVLTVQLSLDGKPWIGTAPLIVGEPRL